VTNQKAIDAILKRWRRDPENVVEMLQDVQEQFRHLPEDALRYLANELDVPLHRLYHIGTFYGCFSMVEKGKHVVQVCMGAGCHVKGAPKVLEAVCGELKVQPGQTTADKLFTVESAGCLGCCSLAPVVSVDGKLFGDVKPEQVPDILRATRTGSQKEAN
jgi:NADH-quinone oxidoreductase subunit E